MNTALRRLEEKERRRTEIVQAAAELAYRQGWDAVTMDGVARHARLSRALVYLYFKDKTALHAALCEQAGAILHQRFREAVARHARGYEQCEAIGRAYVAFAAEMPHYFQAMSRFEARTPETDDPQSADLRVLKGGERIKTLMEESIERGIADGSIRRDVGDPRVVGIALWGMTHGIIQIAATKAAQIARRGVSTQELVDHAFLMLRRALAPAQ
ncbi:MAG: TetR/AcrR family transcriptional regulator; helix-turn-helix transcriptional regulator [Xanthomonadaceae bacterium]|jgi:AcrR family transcriptional regulator|nr:TetR/AcrR family transcriptional regulator; helix-turn-helix transcriptional regulator [Xanthomonadaceae bacterium]